MKYSPFVLALFSLAALACGDDTAAGPICTDEELAMPAEDRKVPPTKTAREPALIPRSDGRSTPPPSGGWHQLEHGKAVVTARRCRERARARERERVV